jgi:poly(A) polymerase
MTAPAARAVIAALEAGGAEVRFVGGCVRDCLLGRDIGDIDIATPEPPELVIERLEAAGLKAVPTGLKHGTVTAVADGRGYEVTTLRVDVESHGRHATVAFTDDWMADAARRDFTFNAMSARPDGTLYDPFAGRGDLKAGRVRFVGEPEARIAEDYLRVLRFFRFLAHFGREAPDAEALHACAEAKGELPRLSAERVRAELMKLLAAPNPVPALTAMAETGVLHIVLPEAGGFSRLLALVGIDERDPLRRLAALIERDGAGVAERLRMSNAEKKRLAALVPPVAELDPAADGRARRRLLYDLGTDLFRDLVLLKWAGDGERRAEAWRDMLEAANRWDNPKLPVKGADVVALGVPKGPEVGRIVAAVEDWWRGHDFGPDRNACLAEARRLIGRVAQG